MTEEILNDTKLILGIEDESKDELLSFYISDTENAVLSYCRLEFVPKQLYGVIAMIAAELFNSETYRISSVTEGDRKVEFKDMSVLLTDSYRKRLDPFKNISGRLPSEVGSI